MFDNMTIKQRLRLFPVIASILITVAALAYVYFSSVVHEKTLINDNSKIVVENLLKARITVYQYLRNPNDETAQKTRESFAQLDKDLDSLSSLLKVEENRKRLSDAKGLISDYVKVFEQVVQIANYEKNAGLIEESVTLKTKIKDMSAIGSKIEEKIIEIDKVAAELKTDAESSLSTALVLIGFSVIILFVTIAVMISKAVLSSIEGLRNGFELINRSDSTDHRLEIKGNDEITEISALFNSYMNKLDTIAQQDKAAIDDIRRVSEMMAIGFVSVRIKAQAGSPALQQTINGFNTALAEMEKATAEISRVMSALGTSDFAVEFETGKYSGELGGMMTSLQGLSESIGDFMALLSKNGIALNQGATTLSNASNDLSGSSNTQASSLEETAAAIEELTSNISANSQKASEMASLAR